MEQKKKSETLSQRDKAQKDILELDLMKRGKMDTGPKPSEIAIKPHTIKEKIDNFFYHHKLKVVIASVVAIILYAGIYTTVTKPRYDAKAVLFCYDNTVGLYSRTIEAYLSQFYSDRNQNGKVEIAVANCSYDKNNIHSNEGIIGLGKLQSIIAGEEDALLYIVTKDTIDYLNSISKEIPFFKEGNIHKLSPAFNEAVKINSEGLKGEFYIALRTIEGTAIEEDAAEHYPFAKEAFENIKKGDVNVQNSN